MRYLLLLVDDVTDWESTTEAERDEVMAAHERFTEAVQERAAMVAGEALADAAEARTLRPRAGGSRVTTDGPYAESAEHLGGFYLVDAPDLATVTELADLLPAAYTIEVRPVIDVSDLTGPEDS